MAKYVTRTCPRCRDYLGVVIHPSKEKTGLLLIDGHCSRCDYELHWLAISGRVGQSGIDQLGRLEL